MNQAYLSSGSNRPLRFGFGELREIAQLELLDHVEHAHLIVSPRPLMEELGFLARLTAGLEARGIRYDIAEEGREYVLPYKTLLIALGDRRSREIAAARGAEYSHSLLSIPVYVHEPSAATEGCPSPCWEQLELTLPTDDLPASVSIIDAELTMHLSPRATALQGLGACIRAIEAYLSTESNPLCEIYALKSVKLLGKYLPRCVKEGAHRKSREKVALGCQLAQTAEMSARRLSLRALVETLAQLYPQVSRDSLLVALAPCYLAHLADVTPKRFQKLNKELTGRAARHPEDFLDSLARLLKHCQLEEGAQLRDLGICLSMEQCASLAQLTQQQLSELFAYDPRRLSVLDLQHILECS